MKRAVLEFEKSIYSQMWKNEKQKQRILDFMATRNNHNYAYCTGSMMVDTCTGEKIPVHGSSFKSGEWTWNDFDIYYVDVYDVQLEQEFINYVEEQYANGFIPKDKIVFKWRYTR